MKLQLNRETLHSLTQDEASDIAAGVLVATQNATTCDFTDGPGCRTKLSYCC